MRCRYYYNLIDIVKDRCGFKPHATTDDDDWGAAQEVETGTSEEDNVLAPKGEVEEVAPEGEGGMFWRHWRHPTRPVQINANHRVAIHQTANLQRVGSPAVVCHCI